MAAGRDADPEGSARLLHAALAFATIEPRCESCASYTDGSTRGAESATSSPAWGGRATIYAVEALPVAKLIVPYRCRSCRRWCMIGRDKIGNDAKPS